MKVCPTCQNMFIMKIQNDGNLIWKCVTCGVETEQQGGCLLMETVIQERASEGYKILLNEFTRQDPTLPHVKTIKCASDECPSNGGGSAAERDVIYMKYDPVNMKFMYVCNVCGFTWRSRS
jgi:DNA-directed RNA polymerase subunit M/transcription elongation factor TFIIS